jgi:pimeloyl-ACP methyl ester carboxylesterase
VLDLLKLERPALAGHSIAGEELSSVGSRYPYRIAGLIYLDAAYPYAFDNGKGTTMAELRRDTQLLPAAPSPSNSDLASYLAFSEWWARTRGFKIPEAVFRQNRPPDAQGRPGKQRTPAGIGEAVRDGIAKFSEINVPVLALCAMPQATRRYLLNSTSADVRAAEEEYDARFNAAKEKQLKSFEEGIPQSRVVRIANADHYIYITNEAEVLRETRIFLSTLK